MDFSTEVDACSKLDCSSSQVWKQVSACKQVDANECNVGAIGEAELLSKSAAVAAAVSARPPLAPGSCRPPTPCTAQQRKPLTPSLVPLPTELAPEAQGAVNASPGHKSYPIVPALPLAQAAAAMEQLSTRHSSSVGGRSPRRCPPSPMTGSRAVRSPQMSPRSCSSPGPTSPRRRMNDVFHGPRSIVRYPECQPRQRRSPSASTSTRGGKTFTTPLLSPRNLANDHHPRSGLEASNNCLEWLKQYSQSDTKVEDLVEEMLVQRQEPNRIQDYRFARDNLRNASYRDATKCATSMAIRTKPPQSWR